MILRALEVEGFRCFADRVEIRPVDERIQILHAPNGSGKSTLLDALRTALFERHRVGGAKTESLRPWGRDLTPTVAVEFAHGGVEYRLVKRFLEHASSELFRREEGRFVRFAEADKADERVRALFTGTPFGRGYSGAADRGVFTALWAPQGELALPALPEDLVGSIRASLGAQTAAPGTDRLTAAIADARAEFFTPGGRERRGRDAPRLEGLRSEREEREAERRLAAEQLDRMEGSQRRVQELRAVREQAAREEEANEKRLGEIRGRAREYAALVAERDLRKAEAAAAESAFSSLAARAEELTRRRRELRLAGEEAERHAAGLKAAQREREEREAVARAAAERREKARAAKSAFEAERRLAREAEEFVESGRRLKATTDRLEKLARAAAELTRAREARAGIVAPSEEEIRDLRAAIAARDKADAHLAAAATTLRIELVAGGRIEVREGEPSGGAELAPGGSVTVHGAPAASADIPGVARIEARGPAGDIARWREEREAAVARLAAVAARHSTDDPAALLARRERAAELDGDVRNATTARDALAEGGGEEDLAEVRARFAARVEELAGRHPGWAEAPPDPVALGEAAAERERALERELAEAESARDAAERARSAAREAEGALVAHHDAARRRAEEARLRVEELAADGLDDEERQRRIDGLAMDRAAAKTRLVAAEARLGELGADPREEEARLAGVVRTLRDRAREALEEEKGEEGRLAELSAGGAWSRLAALEERLAAIDEEIRSEELRRDAVRLLSETVSACRDETLAAVTVPVERAATRLFHRIAGSRLGPVHLSGNLTPEAVEPGVAGEAVVETRISGGEREQLHLAVRLALGEILAAKERQLVVLDDILTATDAGRLARVLAVLEEASERLQIVILTCHPERYGALTTASRRNLSPR